MKMQNGAKIQSVFLGNVREHRFLLQTDWDAGGEHQHCHGGDQSLDALQFEKPQAMRFLLPPPCRTNNKLSWLPNPGN